MIPTSRELIAGIGRTLEQDVLPWIGAEAGIAVVGTPAGAGVACGFVARDPRRAAASLPKIAKPFLFLGVFIRRADAVKAFVQAVDFSKLAALK